MATLVRLLSNKVEIVDEVYRRINEAEANRDLEFQSAVKIQSWFRATRIRVYLKYLNDSARQIQRRWRGFVGRKKYRNILKERVFQMKLNQYCFMARRIQKVWRGYYTRKYIFNYYSRKRYLEGLKVKNEIVRSELEDFVEQQEVQRHAQQDEQERKRLEHYARKHHYLVSTEVMPGVFNSPFQPYPEEMEYHLRHVKSMKPERKEKTEGMIFDPSGKRYDLPPLSPLPPIQQKPQGPFRDLRMVQKQRYKPFQATLRVATSFTAVEEAREEMKKEEWVTRLNDSNFEPFTKKTYEYKPLLYTTSKYGHLPYGTKYYRQEFPEKFITPTNFLSVVPPIPIFEKLNDTYSQGQV